MRHGHTMLQRAAVVRINLTGQTDPPAKEKKISRSTF
jgi:hypothetical protein